MHKGLAITGAALAAATLCLAFAAWMAGPGQWGTVLAIFAAVAGLGVVAVWFVTVVGYDLSGRDEWIVTCAAISTLALAYNVFRLGPTAEALFVALAMGPVLATLAMIRLALSGQWQGWSKPRRKSRVRKPSALRRGAENADLKGAKGVRKRLRSRAGTE